MSVSPLSHLANQYREKLQQRKEQTAQTLTAVHSQTIQHIQSQLDQLSQQIDAKHPSAENKIPLSWLAEGGKLDAFKQFVSDRIGQYAAFARVTTEQIMQWASSLSQQAADLLMKAAQSGFIPVLPKPSSLVSTAVNKMASLFGTFGENAAKGIHEAFALGLSLGSKAQEIVQNINQVLDVPRWRSIAIAATELFKLFNDTLFEHYRGNPTVIMWQWQCKLSLRSCVCCIALHNTLHELTETLDDHVNGECSPLPYFAGQELGQSGIDWFAEQSEETQRAIMGTQVAYDLWKSGKATLQDFIGVRHDAEYGSSVYQQSAKRIMKGK